MPADTERHPGLGSALFAVYGVTPEPEGLPRSLRGLGQTALRAARRLRPRRKTGAAVTGAGRR